jgi:hypothetical protein
MGFKRRLSYFARGRLLDAAKGWNDMPVYEPALQDKESLDTESCWALLERVIASPQLKRAARMREFLLYVGRRSLKEGCDQIPEQEIGSEVFGRPASYDTNADNIVRVNATDLRKRVEDYFATDGSLETLVLEIPRGSYKPVFRQRTIGPKIVEAAAGVLPIPQMPDASLRPAKNGDRRLLALAAVLIVALVGGCCLLWVQNRAMHKALFAWQSTPAVESFWSGILDARQRTDLILADTSFALIEDITKKPIPLNQYLSHSYMGQIQSANLSPDRREDLGLVSQRNYGSIGDFRVAQRIVALDPLGRNIQLYYARDYMPKLIKQDNVILIGSRKSNPWVDLFAGSLNFTVEYDPDRYVSYILNRVPAAGEQAVYASPPAPDPSSGYSVVAYLPNPEQNGKVLILAGTGSEATEGAGEFLTSEDALANFQRLLHVTTLPYFEVLLKTTHLNGTPMDAKIIAYRTYPNPH